MFVILWQTQHLAVHTLLEQNGRDILMFTVGSLSDGAVDSFEELVFDLCDFTFSNISLTQL